MTKKNTGDVVGYDDIPGKRGLGNSSATDCRRVSHGANSALKDDTGCGVNSALASLDNL